MTRDDAALLDIAQAARRARDFAARAADVEAFEADDLVQSAVLHHLMVLGEAVKRLSGSFRDAHPGVPWSLMARMRDRLIHGYDDVDIEAVWTTVSEDVSELLDRIEPLLPDVYYRFGALTSGCRVRGLGMRGWGLRGGRSPIPFL